MWVVKNSIDRATLIREETCSNLWVSSKERVMLGGSTQTQPLVSVAKGKLSHLAQFTVSKRKLAMGSRLLPKKEVEPMPWKGVPVTEQRQRSLEDCQLN
jgi:hypothetical protein